MKFLAISLEIKILLIIAWLKLESNKFKKNTFYMCDTFIVIILHTTLRVCLIDFQLKQMPFRAHSQIPVLGLTGLVRGDWAREIEQPKS